MLENRETEAKGRAALWLEDLSRRHPGIFTFALLLLAVAVTIATLFQTGSPFILYQGF